jgi:HK97 family phage prohead protease
MSYLTQIANSPARTVKFATGGGTGSTLLRKTVLPGKVKQVDDNTVLACVSKERVDRADELVMVNGIDFSEYISKNPIVLWQHDPTNPIARCVSLSVVGDELLATIKFPPAGVSALSDTARGLIKNDIVNAWSIGFTPLSTEPMDRADPRGPQRYLAVELCEISACSIPANRDAITVERSLSAAPLTLAHVAAGCRNDIIRRALAASASRYSAQQVRPTTRAERLRELEIRRSQE